MSTNFPRNNTLYKALLQLELRLLDPGVRGQRLLVAALLDDSFREFGKNARVYSKSEILDSLEAESLETEASAATPQPIRLEDFQVVALGEASALTTYRSVHGEVQALRSSVWVWREAQWRMLFHQGTRLP